MPLFNKPKLNNYISDTTEVGFSQYGPTLSIAGVLTCVRSITFIQKISLNLTYKEDSSQHLFDWFAFRPHQSKDRGYSYLDLKMPSKFMVTSSQPHHYNILFFDRNRYAEMNPVLKKINQEWNRTLKETSPDDMQGGYKPLFESFIKSDAISYATDQLKDLSYWTNGKYSVTMIIVTKSQKILEKQKYFTLTSEDMQNLKQNAKTIVADRCKQRNLTYNAASPKLT